MLFTDFGTALSEVALMISLEDCHEIDSYFSIIGWLGPTRDYKGCVELRILHTIRHTARRNGIACNSFFFTTVLWQLVKATFELKVVPISCL